jgi:membrane protease YdiL (CAAX protease family)
MAALPVLLVVLGLNLAYHAVVRAYLGTAPAADAVVAATGVTPLVVFAYCIQPAVFEELFFRYLALDSLRGIMGVHQAVAISSLMFGLAHVGVPLSIPMLGLVGVPLAYARVATGGLALPMAMHFLHNAIILFLE